MSLFGNLKRNLIEANSPMQTKKKKKSKEEKETAKALVMMISLNAKYVVNE